MVRYVFLLACVALVATLTSAAPANEEPAEPSGGSTGGFLDAFRNAGGQLQRVASSFPESASLAASRFQTWAEGAGSTISKSANDAFGFTRQLFNPRRTEGDQPPSSGSSSASA